MSLDTAIRLSAQVQGGGAIDRVKRSLQDLGKSGQTTRMDMVRLEVAARNYARVNDQTISGIRNSINAFRGLQEQAKIGSAQFKRYGDEISRLESKLRGLDGASQQAGKGLRQQLLSGIAAAGAGRVAGGAIQSTVANEESERRLRSLSQGLDDYRKVQETAAAAAAKFGLTQTQANQEFAQIYARLRPIGLTLEQVSTAYNGFNTAAKLSGTTSAEASAAFLQLSQALGTGVLRGEELNSVFEQTPAVVQAIAQEMGVPIGQIRELAKEGQISSDIVLRALARIETEGAPKLAEAMKGPAQQFKNLQIEGERLQRQLGEALLPAALALTQGLTGMLQEAQKLPEPVKQVGAAAAAAGLAVTGVVVAIAALKASLSIVGGVTALNAALIAAAGSAKVMAAALLLNPWVAAAAGVAALTVAAYKMNEPFRQFVDTYPARFKIFWTELASDATAVIQRITGLVQGISNFIGGVINRITSSVQRAVQNIIANAGFIAPAFQTVTTYIGSAFSAVFSFIENNWQNTVANMINYSNPLMAILKAIGIDVGGAVASAMSYRPNQQQSTPAMPAMPSMPSMPAAAAGAGAGSGGSRSGSGGGPSSRNGGAASSGAVAESIGAQIAKSLQQALNLNQAQAAGIVGNLMRESGLNPRVNEGGAVGLPRGVGGYGIAQWTGSRQTDLVRFSGGANAAGNLQTQLRFLVHELLGPESRALTSLRSTTTPEEAAVVFDRDYERSGIKALPERKANARRVYAEIAGTGPGVGLDDFASGIQAQQQAADELAQKQESITKSLKEFVEQRVEAVTQATKESELLQANSDEERRRIEYEYEKNNIADRYNKLRAEANRLAEEASAVGVENNNQEQIARINAEESQTLANAQLKLEQDLNKIYEERAVLMREIRNAAAMPTVYNELETQKVALDEILQKYPAIGGAADAAANLATRGMAELVAGTKNAKEVFIDFLNGIANALIEAAQKMIAQYIAIGIAKMFAGLGSSTSGFQSSNTGPFTSSNVGSFGFDPGAMLNGPAFAPRALGGPVAAGRPYPVGERGPELFVPYQSGTIVPSDEMQTILSPAVGGIRRLPQGVSNMMVPFQRNAAGSAALSVPFQRGGDSNGDGVGGSNTIDVKFETVRIGEMDFVTRDEAQKMSRQAANQGAEIAQRRIKNNPTIRRNLGMA